MGILNQLREEAAHKKENHLNQQLTKEQLEHNYQTNVLPKMQTIFQFMKELIEHLKFLEHDIKIENYSKQYPQFGTLTQTGYKINTDGFVGFVDADRIMQINIAFQCTGQGSFLIKKSSQFAIEQETAFLHSKHIKFKSNNTQISHNIATIEIYRKFPIYFSFKVDYEQSQINLHIKNHSEFDSYSRVLQPEDVNDSLLDEIARFMLRKDNSLIQLKISNEQKQQIQRRLMAEQAEKQMQKEQNIEPEKPAKTGFFSRIKRFSKNKPT